MKLTNNHNLPESIVRAMERKGERDPNAPFSATELIAPPRQMVLRRRHHDEIEEDAMDRFWALVGDGIHHILESGRPDPGMAEKRLLLKGHGFEISGKPDLYHDGIIHDWKTTSTWSAIFGDRTIEYEQQLNIYAEILESNGYPVDVLLVALFYRDWHQNKVKEDPRYPKTPIEEKRIRLWEKEDRVAFISARYHRLEKASMMASDELFHCSSDEMWEKPTRYAVMKISQKKALRVLNGEHEAVEWQMNNGGDYIVERPGERTRCERYCNVKQFCNQYREYKQEANK